MNAGTNRSASPSESSNEPEGYTMRFTILLVLLPMIALAAAPTTQKVAKPPTVTREQWGSQPKPIADKCKHTPKYITIHHAGVAWKTGRDPVDFVRSVQKWGQRRVAENAALPPEKQKKNIEDWPDLPYHFMIAPDGRIFEARPLEYEPQSNTNYSLQGHIGVELMGSFGSQRPSKAQIESCVAIVAWLCQDLNISPDEIAGHKDRAKDQTTCPGKDFVRYLDSGQFKEWVNQTLASGKLPEIDPGPPLPGGPTVVIDTPTTQAGK
jgi:hypothetical protein